MISMDKAHLENIRRWSILLGVFQILFGCLIGMTPPDAVPWFRGIVMAHLEFTANGVLIIVLTLLLKEMALNKTLLNMWFITLQLGAWANGASGIVVAVTGRSTPEMPTITASNPPPYGIGNPLATTLLILSGLAILVALTLSLIGFWRGAKKAF
jgi:hypothetical protein